MPTDRMVWYQETTGLKVNKSACLDSIAVSDITVTRLESLIALRWCIIHPQHTTYHTQHTRPTPPKIPKAP